MRDDQRRFERQDLSRLSLVVFVDDAYRRTGCDFVRTLDLSLGGVALRAKKPIPVGARLVLRLDRESGEPVIVAGEVRHAEQAEDGHHAGVEFVFPPRTVDLNAIIEAEAA
ncbi:MAG: PilZ domain-containing protein [Planctomycetota bacterium]